MRWPSLFLAAIVCAALAVPSALSLAPPAPAPDKDTLEKIQARTDKLAAALEHLLNRKVSDPQLADSEVFHKAAAWVVKQDELRSPEAAAWTLAALNDGLLRASQAARGDAPWLATTGRAVVRGYRSRIDGSVQPYAVLLPHDYGNDRRKHYRLDVVLHGRDDGLSEVKFLHQHRGERPAPKDLAHVEVHVYGRGNNAYRWAGESDVSEAVANFLAVETLLGRANFLDLARVVLRGFSMGGAGTWHLGLHRPDQWCCIGPGAGFTTTHGYVKGLPARLPDYQEACLHIYDAVDYAENAANVPVVAYAGAADRQLRAARTIEAKLKPLGIPMTLLVAPGVGHRMPPPEWQKKAEAEYARCAERGRPEYSGKIRFVTYTLKYPSCFWLDVMGLERHYRRSSVEAERNGREGYTIKTANVRVLHVSLWPGADRGEILTVAIDGQKLENVRPYQARDSSLHLYLEKRAGRWADVLPERLLTERLRRPQKVSGLQGPIDDAFMAPFLCVRGTGAPWHETTQRYVDADLARFKAEWAKYLRGALPVKDDTAVTAEDIATRHLVLFGDPAGNSLIAQVLPGLPLKWTKKEIVWGGKSYAAADHVPVLIYPSPLATDRYVVLNSGHTFHADSFRDTNALLYPRLGDWAVLKTANKKDPLAVEVVTAGLFDDSWRLSGRPGSR
jgi:dienelactone hydrolase